MDGEIAGRLFVRNTQKSTLEHWIKQTILSRSLKDLVQRKYETALVEAFSIWRQRAVIQGSEKAFVADRNYRLLQRAMGAWRIQR